MTIVIDYLEIENFKSYYGKTKFEFDKKFNALIGPNGSGKSNVLDSLLFLFGFNKKIRTENISDLIHNSIQHPNEQSCSVKISFNNTNETESAKLNVKRTGFNDNTYKYFINDIEVQFEQVETVLKNKGIDLKKHNRFLILQDEIQSLSLLKPKGDNKNEYGLLEYLEDIIGTSAIKDLINIALTKIRSLDVLTTQNDNIFKSINEEEKKLAIVKNEAINFRNIEFKLIEAKFTFLKVSQYKCIISKNNLQEKSVNLHNSISNIEEIISAKRSEINLLSNDSKSAKEDSDQLNCMIEKSHADLKANKKKKFLSSQSLILSIENNKNLNEKVLTETENIKNFNEKLQKNEKLVKNEQGHIEKLKTQNEQANDLLKIKIDKVIKETSTLSIKLKEDIANNLAKLQNTVNETKNKWDLAQFKVEVFMENQNYEQKRLEETRTKIKIMSELLKGNHNSLKELEELVPNIENSLKKVESELKALLIKEKTLLETVSISRVKYSKAQIFSSNNQRCNVLSFLMKLKSEGRINGIFGRLGDLGSIDEKYDVAVSTACDLLDCIVVDTIDTAEACVEKLKEQQVGFATFIALDLQDKFRECLNKKMSTPDDMPRLVELIKVNDPKLLTVFYFSLRDTLVATDLNQAMKIYDVSNQSQRYRVVTLTGEKIEISGTLSGGGRPIRGRMGNNILNDEYTDEKIKETLDKDQELQDTYILKHQLESAFNVLINKLENLKESRFRMNHKGMILNKNLNSLNQNEINISEKISEMIVDAEERKKLEQTAEINRLEYLNALEKASQAKNKNDELAREIFKIRTTIIGDQKENVRKIEEDINIKNKIIIDTKFNIQSTKRNLERSEKNLSNFSIDIKQNEKNLEKNKEDYKNLKAISKELKSNIKNEFEINNIECLKILEINDITNKNCIDIIHNSSKKLINLTNQLMEVKTLIKINQNDLDGILTEIKKLKSNDIEYFEGLRPDFHQFDKKNLDTIDLDELNKSIVKLKEDLSHENPNSACIYKEQISLLEIKAAEQETESINTKNHINTERILLENLKIERSSKFNEGFLKINKKFKQIYQKLTCDGDAALALKNLTDAFDGIEVNVRPPGNTWKFVSNLSGGEKTLVSLSLIFAMHESPFYVMDEIDSALDFKNVPIIANYIKERSNNSQFLVISLKNAMYEICDRLIGVYKVKNCSNSLFILPNIIESNKEEKNNNTLKRIHEDD